MFEAVDGNDNTAPSEQLTLVRLERECPVDRPPGREGCAMHPPLNVRIMAHPELVLGFPRWQSGRWGRIPP
jgi:hypothetical protein